MTSSRRFLLARVGASTCAIPLEHVVETMRALPVQPLAGAPSFVRGAAIVRGVPLPVVDAASLLELGESSSARFVTLRVGGRVVVLAVEALIGVESIPTSHASSLPPLLRDVSERAIEAIGALDSEFLLVLRSTHLVPESVWSALGEGATST